jgi:hypothetical protein
MAQTIWDYRNQFCVPRAVTVTVTGLRGPWPGP